MINNRTPRRVAIISLGLVLASLLPFSILKGDLAQYDAAIAEDHGDGAGTLPYEATLTEPQIYDSTGGTEIRFRRDHGQCDL